MTIDCKYATNITVTLVANPFDSNNRKTKHDKTIIAREDQTSKSGSVLGDVFMETQHAHFRDTIPPKVAENEGQPNRQRKSKVSALFSPSIGVSRAPC